MAAGMLAAAKARSCCAAPAAKGKSRWLKKGVDGCWKACSSLKKVSSHGCWEACSNQEMLILLRQCLPIYRRGGLSLILNR
ncbi:hypothetical protein Pyn_21377 [Prunus yedoensis var. nudiflora]|uniref:Uncharacterized protein n=1 Tax=Prunus yedoensis var. nudiflora TaxID=2094558 RepID=A0A314XF09_PRUYE|nr:hypothetical protein Pyn_21377 [Prunus yedoensis var. nudiflora]